MRTRFFSSHRYSGALSAIYTDGWKLSARTGSPHDGSVKSKIKSMLSSSGSKLNSLTNSTSSTPSSQNPVSGPAEVVKAAKRTLYTANAGDARAVLW